MSRRLLVKVCGLVRIRDAVAAVELGADLIGLNFFADSPRFVSPRRARAIADRVRGAVKLVGVFVNAPETLIRAAIDDLGLDFVQLHGDEPPDFVRAIGPHAVKAFPLATRRDLAAIERFPCPNFHLLDARAPVRGGSGHRANWSLAFEAAAQHRVFLAGGLTPENVATAIRAVRPYGVDVASGVESAAGIKDAKKMDSFLVAVRATYSLRTPRR
ncbi:MAG: phosphoribosylanthranilate isomerase [Deltaproteobacteria bacterium]|nr:phosphoribosylanthranilate isomerase [Deltaproteobacteria bacterium]